MNKEDLIFQKDETTRKLLDAVSDLMNMGLREVAEKRPAIAADVVSLVENQLGTLRITIDLQPKPKLKVCAVSFDGEIDQQLFTIKLEPLPADAFGILN